MMKSLVTVLSFYFLFIQFGLAQDEVPVIDSTKNEWQPHTSVGFRLAPLNLIDFNAPTLQLGMEIGFKSKWYFGIDLGIKSPMLPPNDGVNDRDDWKYFKLKAEVKYAFVQRKRFFVYTGLEGFYFPQDFVRTEDVLIVNDETSYWYERADVKRRDWAVYPKAGIELRTKGGFLFDAYTGIGYRVTKIKHSNIDINTANNWGFWEGFGPGFEDRRNGTFERFHFVIGLKIGGFSRLK